MPGHRDVHLIEVRRERQPRRERRRLHAWQRPHAPRRLVEELAAALVRIAQHAGIRGDRGHAPCEAKPTLAYFAADRLRISSPRRSAARSSPPSAPPPKSRIVQPRHAPRPIGRSPRSVETMSGRVDFSAGIRPATMAVRKEAATVNASTRASRRRSSDTAIGSGSSMTVSVRISHQARPMPTGRTGGGEQEAFDQQLLHEAGPPGAKPPGVR